MIDDDDDEDEDEDDDEDDDDDVHLHSTRKNFFDSPKKGVPFHVMGSLRKPSLEE